MRPVVVTLCGSTRFMNEFIEVQRNFTLQGVIVISVGLFGHKEGLDMGSDTKRMLDELHLRKIDISDEIFVINPTTIVCNGCGKPSRLYTELSQETECCRSKNWRRDSYIGESTWKEIEYAAQTGKIINYLTPIK